jgi:hypothetical protein
MTDIEKLGGFFVSQNFLDVAFYINHKGFQCFGFITTLTFSLHFFS